MTISIPEIQSTLSGSTLALNINAISGGHIRIQTAFLLPEGAYIDVYIKNENQLNLDGKVTLTDFASTICWLDDFQIQPWKSPGNKRRMSHILECFDIQYNAGALECRVLPQDLAAGVMRMGQACLRMADLMFTKRLGWSGEFGKQVADLLSESGFEAEEKYQVTGRDGNVIVIDFFVKGTRTGTGIMPLSGKNSDATHTKSNEIFTRWYDLRKNEWQGQPVTLVDDSMDIYKPQDLSRLADVSNVINVSDEDKLFELLRAA